MYWLAGRPGRASWLVLNRVPHVGFNKALRSQLGTIFTKRPCLGGNISIMGMVNVNRATCILDAGKTFDGGFGGVIQVMRQGNRP